MWKKTGNIAWKFMNGSATFASTRSVCIPSESCIAVASGQHGKVNLTWQGISPIFPQQKYTSNRGVSPEWNHFRAEGALRLDSAVRSPW